MKIALVAPGAIPSQTANSIQVMKMAQALVAEGHELRVYAPGADPGLPWAQLAAHYGLQGQLDIAWLPASPSLRRYDYAWRAWRAAQAWGADLLYTRVPQAAALAASRGLATVFELHEMPSGVMGPRLLRTFLSAPGARRLVLITNQHAQRLQEKYQLPARENFLLVAPSGVDLQRYENLPEPVAARAQLGLAEGFTVGYSGHLYAGRGIGFLLELASQLPEMRFLFIGGREQDVAARRAQAAGLLNVHFTGFVPNAELPLYQAACDLLTMPYGQQVYASGGQDIGAFTSPMKLFEYLAAGRPLLASDLPVLREVLDEGNALLLPSGDQAAWLAALRGLQADPGRRASLAAAARAAVGEYTWEKRARRLLQGLAGDAKI
ncbi:MAG: glycosyltransferase [Anaerolineales bacterium]|nr:glycosyltransferase [Anaerolineales bacterium]